jgi:hypothetical protein
VIPQPLTDELDRLFGNGWKSVPIGSGGFSGATVTRIESALGTYALKPHPISFSDRIASTHAFQEFLAARTELPIPHLLRWSRGRLHFNSPQKHRIGNRNGPPQHPDTLFAIGEYCWELTDWKPGEPVRSTGWIRDEALNNVIDAIATMHAHVRDWELTWAAPVDCIERGLELRASKLSDYMQSGFDRCKTHWESIPDRRSQPVLKSLGRILSLARAVGSRLYKPMQELATIPVPSHWIARDLWREHFLFDGDRITGIIDFTASKISWPGLDLARSLGTFLLDEDPRWEAAIERYRFAVGKQEIELHDVRVTHRVSTILSAMHYVETACQSTESPQAWRLIREPRIAARILELETCMDSIAKAMQVTGA